MATETELLFEFPAPARDYSGEGLPDEVPTDIMLFGMGVTETSKGDFLLDELGAAAIMKRFKEQGIDRLTFDYGHGMVKPVSSDSHKAAGWFLPEMREDGLYATKIEWTPAAMAALKSREYRFFSPAFDFEPETRRINRLINVGLTNMPAIKNQRPLVLSELAAEQETKEDKKMQVLLDSLGVSDEAAAVAKLSELRAELSEAGEQIGKLQALADEGVKAQTELAQLRKEQAAERRATKIEALCAEGKLLDSQKEFAALLSDDQFDVFAKTLAPHPALSKAPVEEPKSKTEQLSDDEKRIFECLGIVEENS